MKKVPTMFVPALACCALLLVLLMGQPADAGAIWMQLYAHTSSALNRYRARIR